MEYDLTALLEDGRCAILPDIISDEPLADVQNRPDAKVEIICSKDDFELDIAIQIAKKMEEEMG